MRKKLGPAITDVGEAIGLDVGNITAHKERVRGFINTVREEIQELPYDFQALRFVYNHRTEAKEDTGTVSVSANGYEVTGASTTFTNLSKPYNQYFIIVGGREYRVSDVASDTSMFLYSPVAISASAAGESFAVYRKFYTLPPMVESITHISDQNQKKPINQVSLSELEDTYVDFALSGELPEVIALWETQESVELNTYADVGGNAGSNTASAAAGSDFHSDGVRPGTLFTVSSTAFTVDRVLSPTKLRLTQSISSALGDHGSATAENNEGLMFAIGPNYATVNNFTLYGKKKVAPLHDDNDYLEEGWWPTIRAMAIAKGSEFLKRNDQPQKEAKAAQALRNLIRDQVNRSRKYPRLKPRMDDRYSGDFH